MNQKISILGCGWLGLPLGIELLKKGNLINGSTTSQNKLSQLTSNGITPFLIDISDRHKQLSNFLSADILVIAITSKEIDDYKNLISKIEHSQIKKVLFVSSTSVYPLNNEIVTEKTPTRNTRLAEIEQLFISNTKFKTTILRFGGLFGYNRKPGKFIKPGNPIKNPEGYINFIHQHDCIQIIAQIIQQDKWNEILNAVSDSHPKRKVFYQREFEKVGRTDLILDEDAVNNYKIVSNQKLKDLLNFEFKYDDLMNY